MGILKEMGKRRADKALRANAELLAGAMSNDTERMRKALSSGADVDAVQEIEGSSEEPKRFSSNPATPLMAACRKGNVVAMRFLLNAGASVNKETHA